MAREPAERELDTIDLQLLRALAAAGETVPKDIHQQRRLDRLDLEGYVESRRQSPAEPGANPSWVYRLTRKGQRALERRQPGI
ncbi:MAG TPA: hypothetical protein VKT49_23385 [Bryobacteraceae bacterium]|nr:hypothetical protein [Bryobacteraceae bacterium]